ncbi:hypothetical protein EMIHUDRAFT_197188 [Emiliania huxleyi CCMP1516]|uniref:Uncharacterized protein n=2 Tax=Emiliania huxleyi TaxID=2903 RepID=A0A0D3ITV1_EMIH1|nr:hypothetical protein EMIHUDRAFT_197188 [Emiliania huxleyi CCMP1516]EOD14686.1 hypothetical protein EMIHUDRAFT_197188 [Emiliania huxleyi CCMP1516]|eukprot:XP_005767115.1 hypothetical protein EMIHUDRAFT_197188 [Emiliania huxleyi CCMP1516]
MTREEAEHLERAARFVLLLGLEAGAAVLGCALLPALSLRLRDSLQNGQEGARRSGPCLTTECLAAQWHAYAEVYGTNGLATGSAAALGTRQPEARPAPPPEAPPPEAPPSAPPSDAPPPRERPLAIWDF